MEELKDVRWSAVHVVFRRYCFFLGARASRCYFGRFITAFFGFRCGERAYVRISLISFGGAISLLLVSDVHHLSGVVPFDVVSFFGLHIAIRLSLSGEIVVHLL